MLLNSFLKLERSRFTLQSRNNINFLLVYGVSFRFAKNNVNQSTLCIFCGQYMNQEYMNLSIVYFCMYLYMYFDGNV